MLDIHSENRKDISWNFLSNQTIKKQVIQLSDLWMTELLNSGRRNVFSSGTSKITGNMTMENMSNKSTNFRDYKLLTSLWKYQVYYSCVAKCMLKLSKGRILQYFSFLLLFIYYNAKKIKMIKLMVKLVLIKAAAIREFPIKGFKAPSLVHKEQKELLM